MFVAVPDATNAMACPVGIARSVVAAVTEDVPILTKASFVPLLITSTTGYVVIDEGNATLADAAVTANAALAPCTAVDGGDATCAYTGDASSKISVAT